jgi:hypothetical protein
MTIEPTRFQELLGDFKLERLFNELGWDHPGIGQQDVTADGEKFALQPIAQKRGVTVFVCSPGKGGAIPPRVTLLKIEKETGKLVHEHLLVFTDAAKTMLTWLWVARAPGQPTSTRTHTWHKGQSGESLRQKLEAIVWSLEEEEAVTLTEVITGLRRAFDRDRVSKNFFDRFQEQHAALADFIKGLDGATEKSWYASLMLNRLMFVYFIQKKGFLAGNTNYLAERLRLVQECAGKGRLPSFYRQFLRRLFHEGLGQPKPHRKPDLANLIGDVPYLNGGLFDTHELEVAHPGIDIPDEVFEQLFAFFDRWEWHLDDRPLRSGNEINPDVLGYIFEKYINQKQMGAYYTKEDITEYIAKNTVIPHLLEAARECCQVAFDGEASAWGLLKDNPDRYLYPAMKVGVIDAKGVLVPESALPDFVRKGMKDAKVRMFERRYNLGEAAFNTATGERGTLPTETWREYAERRQRALAIRERLAKGEIRQINDLVTLNLDIRQFLQDIIDTCASPDLLKAIWHAIVGGIPEKSNGKFRHGITILDPTSGSGAFLLAALNVLEPLYEGCLDRMEGFAEDAKRLGKAPEADFGMVLCEVQKHSSRRFYVAKNIILHNLFGVDITAEAVEICKLRLFLKLVSQVDNVSQLAPLPDIDFNIRCGNTLVGYTTEAQFDASAARANESNHHKAIKAGIAKLAELFDCFHEQQTEGVRNIVKSEDKAKLRGGLVANSLELDIYLARDYGIDPDKPKELKAWRESHQPFHWFAEFHGVMQEGGFDVLIGNPPYIEYSKIRGGYQVYKLDTEAAGNLYAYVIERSYQICHPRSRLGMIVQLSAVCTDRMLPLQKLYISQSKSVWSAAYDDRPGKLFDGLEHIRASILLSEKGNPHPDIYSTTLRRWATSYRPYLIATTSYEETSAFRVDGSLPKIGSKQLRSLVQKIRQTSSVLSSLYSPRSQSVIYYYRSPLYWIRSMDFLPHFSSKSAQRSVHHFKDFGLADGRHRALVGAIINSSLFYLWFIVYGNGRNVALRDITTFPMPPTILKCPEKYDELFFSLMADYKKNSAIKARKDGVRYQEFYPARSKSKMDDIDLALAKEYGFDDAEIDLVINYDIKYRMGGAGE